MSNYSRQREVILEVIKKNRTHPTAEEIYNLVIEKEPRISKSTVYRNINILVEQELIQKIVMATGPDRYDYEGQTHQHAICEVCAKVFDYFYDFETLKIAKSLKKQTGIDLDVNSIKVYGICENCKSKK